MSERDKVTVDDIIGLIHTDEATNSVEEVRKLRGRETKTEKRFTTQRIYKGFDGEKIYDWCVMDYDNVLLRLTTRMDCKDVCEELNALHEENKALCDKCEKQKAYVIDTKMQNIKLHEENEDLKAEVYILQDDILNKRVRTLKEENKQLKQEIEILQEQLAHIVGDFE